MLLRVFGHGLLVLRSYSGTHGAAMAAAMDVLVGTCLQSRSKMRYCVGYSDGSRSTQRSTTLFDYKLPI